MEKQRILSGVQPTGNPHIGTYLGVLKQYVQLQRNNDALYCVVDEHAITVPQNPKELYESTLKIAMIYLAVGLDPRKTTLFVQSHISAHAELGWILNTMTPLGELERMTQFKEKKDMRSEVYAGLLNYPTLMAADILLYQANLVPVGEDQAQHIELTRSLARRFNNRFGQTFVIPQGFIPKRTSRIMGLDDPTKKMSKSAVSANNYIALLDPPDEIRRKIKIAVTDSEKEVRHDEKRKPAIANLMRIYGAFSDETFADLEKRYAGKSYAEFKTDLGQLLVEKLTPLQKKYRELEKDKQQVLDILHQGAERAREIAGKTLRDVQEKIGFVPAKK